VEATHENQLAKNKSEYVEEKECRTAEAVEKHILPQFCDFAEDLYSKYSHAGQGRNSSADDRFPEKLQVEQTIHQFL
jgi:hypothetical protein